MEQYIVQGDDGVSGKYEYIKCIDGMPLYLNSEKNKNIKFGYNWTLSNLFFGDNTNEKKHNCTLQQ